MSRNRRVCLLTGAGGLLGSAICTQWKELYSIVAVCRSRIPPVSSQLCSILDPLESESNAKLSDVYVIKADILDDRQLEHCVEIALARYGKIDLVINNAAYFVMDSIVESDALIESASKQFETNVIAPMKLARIVARKFWQKEGKQKNQEANRHLINVSSISGIRVYENLGQSVYAASKSALNHVSLYMASEFAKFGVRVNAVAPTSFPAIIPTESVVEHMRQLDESKETGRIMCVDLLEKAN
jgi:NAD(P)-dependent dehydrogenase (short-subunit alcohol dehydrogenase family)